MIPRLLYLVSHPIQYQAPLLRLIAADSGLHLRVLFERVDTVAGYHDPGFGTHVRWDVPLRDGYDNIALAETDLAAEIAAADVIWLHGWASPVMRRTLRLAARLGKPVLMRAENWDGAMPDGIGPRGWLKRLYLRWIFARCRGFLAIGSANGAYYRRFGINDDRIITMPYAVDNAFFAAHAAQADTASLRHELGIEPEQQVILYAGKFQRRKHPEQVVAAWKSLRQPRPALLMVGDGEMRAELEAMAEPGMIFAGFRNQTQLPAFYALADVFVLPSEHEPWGLAVNEAMACGTAVVVSDQVGAAFDLVDDSTGAVFAAGDIAALTVGLAHVLDQSEIRGQAAASRIATWDFRADLAGLHKAVAHVLG
ncbi:putative glycosyltransferase [Magnetospirillum gryphiswaldense MSR-1 v2]|uniref:Glycosyltransferase n=1 Tax=Magnetospirillum gryphiswaldense (strain DSM 6361 / JCM 21280 / NBRC 15271 / MSR-1) TaxID=431944 RepID=V6F7Z5_MAGGM|nr:glycosyltransferase family 4 protein [Magnetospirillum gryphiswaldense]CDL00608.1 putative glycosyltransferase [Magnetospirillum gryphiswaldense MSR-1 v2]